MIACKNEVRKRFQECSRRNLKKKWHNRSFLKKKQVDIRYTEDRNYYRNRIRLRYEDLPGARVEMFDFNNYLRKSNEDNDLYLENPNASYNCNIEEDGIESSNIFPPDIILLEEEEKNGMKTSYNLM